MAKLRLIQRGIFQDNGIGLTGEDGVVDLDYMGNSEFECGAIPKAYRRLMYNFDEYEIIHTGIYTPEHDELLVFCLKNYAQYITQAISEFIDTPYHLQEWSGLEKVPKAKKEDTSFSSHTTDFWWCIDIEAPYGNWMAFLSPRLNLFMKAITNDYQNWWLKKTKKEREEEYRKSLR